MVKDSNGVFSLFSTILAPNTCYYAGKAEIGTPDGYVVAPEILPVILNVEQRVSTFCLMVVWPIFHTVSNLNLDGKNSILAFVVEGGKVVDQASLPVEEEMRLPMDPFDQPVPWPFQKLTEGPSAPWPFNCLEQPIPWPFYITNSPAADKASEAHQLSSVYRGHRLTIKDVSDEIHNLRFDFTLSENLTNGSGTIVMDPNTCQINEFGDMTNCTKMQPLSKKFTITAIKLGDPSGLNRRIYIVKFDSDVPHPPLYFVVLNEKPFMARLVYNPQGDDGWVVALT